LVVKRSSRNGDQSAKDVSKTRRGQSVSREAAKRQEEDGEPSVALEKTNGRE